jgi:hypothetical protein
MNAALLRKESRDLLPWGVLGLALGLSNVVEFLLEQIDLAPLGHTFRLLNQYNIVVYWVMAFAIGTGLAIREHDDRTLGFLDGLPVSRSRVFLVKCAVMSAFVLIGPLLDLVTISALHLLSRGSLDRALHGALLLQAFALQALLLVSGLMLGAAFGRLRSLAWLFAGLAATAVILLVDRVPRAAVLNPLTLLDWEWTSTGIVVDGETVCVQAAAGAIAAIVAWWGFVRAGKTRRPLSVSGPIMGAIVVVATVGAGITALMLATRNTDLARPEAARSGSNSYEFAPSPPAQTLTRHYRFSYPADEAEAALALAGEADVVFERVHALLGVAPGDVVDVDASGSAVNTDGTAFLGRLRMRLDSDAIPVLAHETAHVAAQRLAGAERDWLWQAATVLSEGLASWIETQFRERAERTDERMLVLAAMHARRELIIEELADPLVLSRVRDENVKYAAGEALIAALVRLHGEAALPRLLQAFDDPRLPSDLGGLPLWQSTFQLAGFDLAAVVDEFYRAVTDFAALNADRVAALPRPRVVLVRIGRTVGALAVIDPPGAESTAAYEFVMRFRPAPDSPLSDYRQFPAVANQPVWPAARNTSGGRVCVQPGVRLGAEVLYEPWVCLPTSDAVAFDAVRSEQSPPAADVL